MVWQADQLVSNAFDIAVLLRDLGSPIYWGKPEAELV